jgi:hypothetical protein
MLKAMIILLLVLEVNFSIESLLQGYVISPAAATNESLLRVVGHKCVKEVEILSCSGRVNNEGSANTNLVDLIIYFKNNNGKITNMIETTTRPPIIASSEHGIYNITVDQSRLTPDWVTSGAFAFFRRNTIS